MSNLEIENILVVDDEEAIREVVSTMLETKGYNCTAVSNGRAAQEQIKKCTPDLVLSDMIMPEMDGIKLLEWLRTYDPEVPVIMVTTETDPAKRKEMVWQIERKLIEDAVRPIIFFMRQGTCWQPQVKGLTLMENSIFNSWRMEDVWLDR